MFGPMLEEEFKCQLDQLQMLLTDLCKDLTVDIVIRLKVGKSQCPKTWTIRVMAIF